MQREYFHVKTAEFPCGAGEILTEFIDGVATRQISHPAGGQAYASSSAQDWNPEIGFLLFDGLKDALDIPPSDRIQRAAFERAWAAALNHPPLKPAIRYDIGDAAVAQSDATLIAHVVNDLGKWGRGFVIALGRQYPAARAAYLELFRDENSPALGTAQFLAVDHDKRIYVANMVAQAGIRKNARDAAQYLSYPALVQCLEQVCAYALSKRLTVQMPKVGAGLGGGDWNVVSMHIAQVFSYYKQTCKILRLE